MKPRHFMVLGLYVGAVVLVIDVMTNPLALSFAAFGGGAVFGMGYVMWEERQKP